MSGEVQLELLIVVKSYPTPSQSYGDASCIIGICKDRGFVRLYPIPFRKLSDEQKFRKYQLIRIRARVPKSDPRPNTFRPIPDTLELVDEPLSTKNKWQARKDWVLPRAKASMCEIMKMQREENLSMGVFQPAEITNISQEIENEDWSTAELAKLGQRDLFYTNENKPLEKLPYRWHYQYRCSDPSCTGHKQSIIDWEIGQFFRQQIKSKGITDPLEIHEMIKKRFLQDLCGADKDTYFFTGNMVRYPSQFLILGVFWPPVDLQGKLF